MKLKTRIEMSKIHLLVLLVESFKDRMFRAIFRKQLASNYETYVVKNCFTFLALERRVCPFSSPLQSTSCRSFQALEV